MTVAELIEKLKGWPQDCTVVKADSLDNFQSIGTVNYWAAYNQSFVVID